VERKPYAQEEGISGDFKDFQSTAFFFVLLDALTKA
jgi:hypothetical protein